MLKQGETVHTAVLWRISKFNFSDCFPLTEYLRPLLFLCILEAISYTNLYETLQPTVNVIFKNPAFKINSKLVFNPNIQVKCVFFAAIHAF